MTQLEKLQSQIEAFDKSDAERIGKLTGLLETLLNVLDGEKSNVSRYTQLTIKNVEESFKKIKKGR
jgi:hypothetical protein